MIGEESFVEEDFYDEDEYTAAGAAQLRLPGNEVKPKNLSTITEEDLFTSNSNAARMPAGRSFEEEYEEESSAFGNSCGLARSFGNRSGGPPLLNSFQEQGTSAITQHQQEYFNDPTRDMAIVSMGLMPHDNGANSWDSFTTPRKSNMGKKRVVLMSPTQSVRSSEPAEKQDKENIATPPRPCISSPPRRTMPSLTRSYMRSPPRVSNTQSPPAITDIAASSANFIIPPQRQPSNPKGDPMSRIMNKVNVSTPKQERGGKVPKPFLDVSAIPGGRMDGNFVDGLSFHRTADEQGSVFSTSQIEKGFSAATTIDVHEILNKIRESRIRAAAPTAATVPERLDTEARRIVAENVNVGHRDGDTGPGNLVNTSRNRDLINSSTSISSQHRKMADEVQLQQSRRSTAMSSVSSAVSRPSAVASQIGHSASSGPLHINKRVLYFGCVDLGDNLSDKVTLTSNIDEAQCISLLIKCRAGGFKLLNESKNLLLAARETVIVNVEFRPSQMARYKGQLVISSDKYSNSYTIGLRGAGGCSVLRPVNGQKELQVTSHGFAICTDAQAKLKMKIENTGARRVFCAVVLMLSGKRLDCTVAPTPYLILARGEIKEIVISTKEDLCNLGLDPRPYSQASNSSRCSSVSTASIRSEKPCVMLFWGEDLLRQRLVRHMGNDRESYEYNQVKFAAEEFTGSNKEDWAPEWSLSKADVAAFETFLRRIPIWIHSTRMPRKDLDETLKPDDTMERSLFDATLVPDVTRM